MSIKYCASNTLYLAGSGTIVGATSVVLTSFTDIYGNVLTMSDFGTRGFITLEPDTTNEEQATFTGVTSNANGTYTLTGVKTILAKYPYTETSGLIRGHIGGSKLVITDNVAFWDTFANKTNDETITGQWTFDVFPITPSNSDASTTVKGVTKLSVAPDSATNPIAVGANVLVQYSVDAAGSDTYVITPSPAILAYAAGQIITFKAGTANTGAATLNVNGLGAKSIKKDVSLDLATGDILANQIVQVEYDGTNFQLMSYVSNVPVIKVYTSNDTYTKPSGLKYATVETQGSGGNGGTDGSGGGGGAYSKKIIPSSSIGTTESVTVGAAGAGTGNTSFGSLLVSPNGGNASGLTPGTGGIASGGDLNLNGETGENFQGGSGGDSLLGKGGTSQYNFSTTATKNGVSGYGFGSGGSGGQPASDGSPSGGTGGSGTVGTVIVTEYF